MTNLSAQFQDLDASDDPVPALNFLDAAENTPEMTGLREHTYRLIAELTPRDGSGVGHRKGVDVGCGCGRAVADLNGRGMAAVGADRSTLLIEAARSRYPALPFLSASADDLPFKDRSLGWYRAERLYPHLPDPAAALAEARRVLVPGGAVVLVDPIMESLAVDSALPDVTRAIGTALTDACPNGRAATGSHGDLAAAGFTDIAVYGHAFVITDLAKVAPIVIDPGLAVAEAMGRITSDQAAGWRGDLERRARDGRFLGAITFVTTVGRAPVG